MGTDSNHRGRGNPWLAEAATWWTAWRAVPRNPVYNFFALAESRRLAAIPRWRRWLLSALLVMAALALPLANLDQMLYIFRHRFPDITEIISYSMFAILWVGAAVWIARLIPVVFETALGVMGYLSADEAKHKGPRIDDSIAVSNLTDHELAVAAVRLYWPRLAWFSLGGAVLLVLFLIAHEEHLHNVLVLEETSWILLLSPLTIAALAVAGALGGLIYVLWLLALGNGMRKPLFASLTGALCGIGYLAYIPMVTAFASQVLSVVGMGGSDSSDSFWNPIFAAGHTVLIAVWCGVLYRLAERFTGVRTFLAPGTPLLFLLGAGLHVPMFFFLETQMQVHRADELTGVSAIGYLIAWSGTVVFNPLAVPLPQCYGWDWDEWLILALEWYRYPLLLLLQIALVLIGMRFARRAVRLRRQGGV